MRGGVSSDSLMYTIDLSDIEVMNKVIEENIESTKKSGLPLI